MAGGWTSLLRDFGFTMGPAVVGTHEASVASLSSILSEVTDSRAVLVSLAASARG